MTSRNEFRQRFNELATDAEYQLSVNPIGYKRKVLWLGLLGYAAIAALLLLLLTALGGSIWLATFGTVVLLMLIKSKLIFLLLALVWFLLKAVWVKLSPPEGYLLSRAEFPTLWREVEALQQTLKTPKIHRIVLVPEMNAAIAQTPRLGLFGWQQNSLVLGLELLLALSAPEGKAVLAHEMGHLSAAHAKFNGWVYRLRQSWQQIDYLLNQQTGWLTAPLRRFFSWYSLTFSGYTFALARFNEYEADQVSVATVGADATASALCYSQLLNQALADEFWQPLWRNADAQAAPPADCYQRLAAFLRAKRLTARPEQLHLAMAERHQYDDTHPSLLQRLHACNQGKVVLLNHSESAAEALLGDQLNPLLQYYSEQWQLAVTPAWQEQQQQHQQATEQLTSLSACEVNDYSIEQALAWLAIPEHLHPTGQYLPTLRQLQQRFSSNAALSYALACALTSDEPATAEQLFIQASHDFQHREAALSQLYAIANEQRDEQRTAEWQLQLDNHYDHCDRLLMRWQNLEENEAVSPAQPSAQQLAQLQVALASISAVRSAVLVQRQLPSEFDEPSYILYITTPWYRNNGAGLLQKVADALADKLNVFVINKDFTDKKLLKTVKQLGVPVYPMARNA